MPHAKRRSSHKQARKEEMKASVCDSHCKYDADAVLPSGRIFQLAANGAKFEDETIPWMSPGSVDDASSSASPFEVAGNSSISTHTGMSSESSAKSSDLVNTLQSQLASLQEGNAECVFIVRGIGRMGFKSRKFLSAYGNRFGKVEKVLIAPSKAKPLRGTGAMERLRPGSFGFVCMDSKQSVDRVLACGTEHQVAGFKVRVERFRQVPKCPSNTACSECCSAVEDGEASSKQQESSQRTSSSPPGSQTCTKPMAVSSEKRSSVSLQTTDSFCSNRVPPSRVGGHAFKTLVDVPAPPGLPHPPGRFGFGAGHAASPKREADSCPAFNAEADFQRLTSQYMEALSRALQRRIKDVGVVGTSSSRSGGIDALTLATVALMADSTAAQLRWMAEAVSSATFRTTGGRSQGMRDLM